MMLMRAQEVATAPPAGEVAFMFCFQNQSADQLLNFQLTERLVFALLAPPTLPSGHLQNKASLLEVFSSCWSSCSCSLFAVLVCVFVLVILLVMAVLICIHLLVLPINILHLLFSCSSSSFCSFSCSCFSSCSPCSSCS